MTEIIQEYPYLIEQAKNACETAGITPLILPIRGGTDGAHLSYMGLPCPNLGTGGHALSLIHIHASPDGCTAAFCGSAETALCA